MRIAGWALDSGGTGIDSGVEAVHIWAYPSDGGPPLFLGAAALRDPRPDVAAHFGARAALAVYHLTVSNLPVGDYVVAAYAKSRVLSTFSAVAAIALTIGP